MATFHLAGEARKGFLNDLFRVAVAAADPSQAIARHLPDKPNGRVVVIGAGKASAVMARAFEQAWREPVEGVVVTRYGHGVPTRYIQVLEASHPVPDNAGLVAAKEIMDAVSGLTHENLVVALMSGGGSALLPAPFGGLTLEDEQAVHREFLASAMPIDKMNKVRMVFNYLKENSGDWSQYTTVRLRTG